MVEKIPYLKSLGVTAVELMPVHEFPILDCFGQTPPRQNYWGYDPMALFSPIAAMPSATNRAARSASSRRWSARCTPPASR